MTNPTVSVLEETLPNLENSTAAVACSSGHASQQLAFYKQLDMSIENAYEYTSKVMTKNMGFNDAKEGIDAFIEKRSPNWKN